MKYYYKDVPELGNVAVSRHAQDRLREWNISEETFMEVLFNGEITPEGHAITWREGKGIRLIIVNKPEPFSGAKLVKTVFKVQGQKRTV